jgi:hypothetical protein
MRDIEIRHRMREGWTLEAENGQPFLRDPSGEKVYDRTLSAAISRMAGGRFPMLREAEATYTWRRWELC